MAPDNPAMEHDGDAHRKKPLEENVMSVKPIYDGSSEHSFHQRTVVTPSGDAQAKNYDSREQVAKSRDGSSRDVGLTVRVDGRVDLLTPAQKTALQALGQDMAEAMLKRLGADTDFGFKPGMVVRAHRDHEEESVFGYVEKQADGGLYLRCLTVDDLRLKRVFIPMSVYQVEEIPGKFGKDGFVTFMVTEMENHADAIFALDISPAACREIWEWLQNQRCYEDWITRLLERIGDYELIVRTACSDSRFRFLAAPLVKEQALLGSFLKLEWAKDASPDRYEALVAKVEDEVCISEAAVEWMGAWDRNGGHSQKAFLAAALKRVTRPENALRLLKHANFPKEHLRLLDLIEDQAALEDLVLHGHSSEVRPAAIERLDDASIVRLTTGFKDAQDGLKKGYILRDLIDGILDQAILEKFCLDWDGTDLHLQERAIGRLTDLETMLCVLRNKPKLLQRHQVPDGPYREEALLHIVFSISNDVSRVDVLRRATDRIWLNRVVEDVYTHQRVKDSAWVRIQELRQADAAPKPNRKSRGKKSQ